MLCKAKNHYVLTFQVSRLEIIGNEMNGVLIELLCTYRLKWARRTSWRWWDKWDDSALQTRNSSPGGLRSSTLPLGHGGSPQYWIITSERRRNIFFFETWRPEWCWNPRSPTFQAGSFNHCTRPPAPSDHAVSGKAKTLFYNLCDT